jgi:RNA polymerase-binding transcription factor DksA
MDTIHVKRYQERLLRRRDQILQTVRRLEEETGEITGNRHFDWLDQAQDENELRLLDHLSDSYLQEMGRIEMALGRMLAGTYGLCVACHQPIEKSRLKTFPHAEFCLECQDIRERFERFEKGGSYG